MLHHPQLANILLSDLSYIFFHVLISSSDMGQLGPGPCHLRCSHGLRLHCLHQHRPVPHGYCAAYSLAVTHPLYYLSFMSCETALKVLVLIWLLAYFFPTLLIWLSRMPGWRNKGPQASCS